METDVIELLDFYGLLYEMDMECSKNAKTNKFAIKTKFGMLTINMSHNVESKVMYVRGYKIIDETASISDKYRHLMDNLSYNGDAIESWNNDVKKHYNLVKLQNKL